CQDSYLVTAIVATTRTTIEEPSCSLCPIAVKVNHHLVIVVAFVTQVIMDNK
ncbi:hypothetical protein S83_060186, partial [Arachis hypogaea]